MASAHERLPMLIPDGGTSLAETLRAFSAGWEVPGSGSAAALHAALAAAVVSSVATKTYEHRDELSYRASSRTVEVIARRAAAWSRELLELVTEDARAFAPVIAIRREAKTLREKYDQDQALRREIAATKPATEIPIRIASIALRVADDGIFLVERGFVAARGESQSGLLSALAAADSAIYVARLNIGALGKKIVRLNDPGYEKPWLRQVTKKANDLSKMSTGSHKRERVLRARYQGAQPVLRGR